MSIISKGKNNMNNDVNRKYRIKELIDALPYSERKESIQSICRVANVSSSMLRRIWNYKVTDSNEAKPSQLLAIAEFFGVDIYELLSNMPAAQKS